MLEAADDFHEIPDIIARHAMLEAVQHDLRRQQQAAAENTETAKRALPLARIPTLWVCQHRDSAVSGQC